MLICWNYCISIHFAVTRSPWMAWRGITAWHGMCTVTRQWHIMCTHMQIADINGYAGSCEMSTCLLQVIRTFNSDNNYFYYVYPLWGWQPHSKHNMRRSREGAQSVLLLSVFLGHLLDSPKMFSSLISMCHSSYCAEDNIPYLIPSDQKSIYSLPINVVEIRFCQSVEGVSP